MEISYKRLWKVLIDKSQSSVAKMSRGEPVNLETILKICAAFNCDIGDVCEAVPEKPTE